MANKNIFAPPTEEELQQDTLFAPPTEQELQSSSSNKESTPGIFSKIGSSVVESLKEGNVSPIEFATSTLQKLTPKLETKDFNPIPYLTGAQQGFSVGASDEIAGGIGAVADMTVGNSPSLENESNLDRYKRLYKEYRDMERKRLASVEKENPEAYLAGDIGASFLLPYGKVAKSMEVVAPNSKLIQGLGTAQLTGFAEGLGRTEEEELPQIISDARNTAAISSAIPLGLTATKAGVNTVKAITPASLKEKLARSYELGKKGLNIREQPVINQIVDEFKDTTEKQLSKPIQELSAEIKTKFDTNKANIDSKISEIENLAKSSADEQALQQNITNEALRTEVGNKVAQKAQDIQSNVSKLKNTLSQGYSTIDSLAEKDKITINTRDFIKQFVSDLGTDSELDDAAITSLYKKLDKYNGDISIADFNSLKREINKLTSYNPTTPRTRGLAKQAYGRLNETYANQLEQIGRQDLATMTKELNKSWSAMSGFDDFVESSVDRNLKTMVPEEETVKSIAKLAKEGPETQGTNQKFIGYLKSLFPNEDPEDLKKLAKSYENTKNFTPNIQSKEQQLANNEEYQNLLKLRDTPQQLTPVEQKMTQFSGSPDSINKKILNLAPKTESKLSSNLSSQQEIDDLYDILGQTKGPDYVTKAKEEISDKLLNYDVAKSANPGQTFDVTTKAQQIRSIYDLVTQGGLTAMANRLGRNSKNFQGASKTINPKNLGVVSGTTASIIDENKLKQDTLRQYAEKASPEELQANANDLLLKYGKKANKLANEINNMKNKDTQGRRAAIFSIMQDPNNRQILLDENESDIPDGIDVDEDGVY